MQRTPSHSRTQRGAHGTALSPRRRPSGPARSRPGRAPSVPARRPHSQPDPTPTPPALRTLATPSGDRSKMMLQHPGQVSASEVSASAIVPCLSPPGSLVFEDFANLTPFVKEELRFAIQNKHLCHRMSSALESVTVSGRPLEMSVTKAEVAPEEDERKKRRRERNKIAAAKCRNKKKEKTECLQKVGNFVLSPSSCSRLSSTTSCHVRKGSLRAPTQKCLPRKGTGAGTRNTSCRMRK
uniref:Activating transcription factor 3 n=2 Tax=Sus scrofa TaxID=9823 RepID=A0A4X1TME3_PIG